MITTVLKQIARFQRVITGLIQSIFYLKRGHPLRLSSSIYPDNLLDLIKDEHDTFMATQLAESLTKNIDSVGREPFFEEASVNLIQGLFLLSKNMANKTGQTQICDLMLASAILSLPNLGKRLKLAFTQDNFSLSTIEPLQHLISVSNSPLTEASIIGTVQQTFHCFVPSDVFLSTQFKERLQLAESMFPLPPNLQD